MNSDKFLLGADLSLAKRMMDGGFRYREGGAETPLLEILRNAGMSCARLRIFNEPSGHGAQVNDLDYTLDLAQSLQSAGFELYLAPHYSDTWADPGKQFTPKAWASLTFPHLLDAVYSFSKDMMESFRKRGLIPKIVQVGNEITPGMLWDHGRIAPGHSTASLHWDPLEKGRTEKDNWARFGEILKAGIAGVTDGLDTYSTEIMLHIDRGGDWETSSWFYENIEAQGVLYDVIGLSYYPFWHGTPNQLQENCCRILDRFGKGIYLAEMAYPFRGHSFYNASLCGNPDIWEEITREYPLSPLGQKRFVEDVTRIMMELPSGGGRGAFYWAPEWVPLAGIPDEGDAETCWARALFDADGNALPALHSFRNLADLGRASRESTHQPVATRPSTMRR